MDISDWIVALIMSVVIGFLVLIICLVLNSSSPVKSGSSVVSADYDNEIGIIPSSVIGYGVNGKIGIRLGDSPLQINVNDGNAGLTLFGF